MPHFPRLNINDKRELTDALLNCNCLKTQRSRDQVIDDLPEAIRHKIDRLPNDRQDVMSILSTCVAHTGDIECLMEIVGYYEGNSLAWQHLVEVRQKVFSRTNDQLNQLGRSLAETLHGDAQGDVIGSSQIEHIREQIERVNRISGQTGFLNRRDTYLDDVMHEINYTEIRDFLDKGDRRYKQDGFAALCLIQNSDAFGGEWCLKRIQDWLHKKGAPPNEVLIGPSEGETMNALFILKRLAAKFSASHPAEDLHGYTQSIIQRICGSIHIGGRLLIVIRQWEDFTDQEITLDWLINDFWRPLVHAFRQSENRSRARLMVVVMSDLEISQQGLTAQCCDPNDFDCEKIVRLQLRTWKKPELVDWLMDHWAELLKLSQVQVNLLADKIYAASGGGTPLMIYRQARKRLLMEAI